MSAAAIFICLIIYFLVLMGVSWLTGRIHTNDSFFLAGRKSPWYLIAFGMIGSSISGVTFISVPGAVGTTAFSYFEVVLGYMIGYWVIGWVLLPMFYRLQLTSIYTYLKGRFGFFGYKTGASFFLLSRIIGAAFRLYVAVEVLQICIFNQWGIPFLVNATGMVALIWLYTRKGGMKTIIWTDALQTTFLIAALVGTIYLICQSMHFNISGLISSVQNSPHSQIFFWDWKSPQSFYKQFASGIFIAIAMTGLDQDMMQKNLTCKSIGEAQKNIFSFSIIQAVVVFMFLVLGSLLYTFTTANHIAMPAKPDDLYPTLATQGSFGTPVAFLFVMGLIAASFASADSALTALTTSFCVDILNISQKDQLEQLKMRKYVHILMAVSLIVVIVIYKLINDPIIIQAVFKVAGYTYGPLLGLYAFGMLTKINTNDKWIPAICIISPIVCYIINSNSVEWFNGYKFGFEMLIINALLTFIGLLIASGFTRKLKHE
ncbi:MAG TPA: sodium:solute symporter [Bacteroidia bacterium]|nr:sodium:solute symporter [Bacteroidia bacterium]